MNLPYKDLAAEIKKAFIEKDNYLVDKYVPAFELDDKFLGDFFSYIMLEPQGENPPIFYHVFSPYDVISQKAPQQATVFQNGKLLLNIDFTKYVYQRTGIMDALVLDALGATDLQDKRILFIGTGRMASASINGVNSLFPAVKTIDCFNPSNDTQSFADLGKSLGVSVKPINDLSQIGDYDYIFCHTNTKEAFLTTVHKNMLKKGMVLTTYVSEDFTELTDEFYTNDANIIVDWDKTLSDAKDLKRAIEKGLLEEDKVIRLKDLFEKKAFTNPEATYTIYRSHGTPMQNLAVLKLIMKHED